MYKLGLFSNMEGSTSPMLIMRAGTNACQCLFPESCRTPSPCPQRMLYNNETEITSKRSASQPFETTPGGWPKPSFSSDLLSHPSNGLNRSLIEYLLFGDEIAV